MATLLLLLATFLVSSSLSSSAYRTTLNKHSSLSVENPKDVLISSNGVFSAGFHPVGDNAYCFSIWFSRPGCRNNCTVVWTANRDNPVNGKRSKLSLQKTGNLVLTDAEQSVIWSIGTASRSAVQLQLQDNGNLILSDLEGVKLWQSFDSPTDTLLPEQKFTKDMRLVSTRSATNISSGYYKLVFHQDNVLFLVFNGPETSSIYWPDPWILDNEEAGRWRYNDSKIAVFDNEGHFLSSDNVEFRSLDFGAQARRRLTLDFDGNLRLYSLEESKGIWYVTWEAMAKPCRIHGACGRNSACVYDPGFGRKCTCPPRFRMKNPSDMNYGCEAEFKYSCNQSEYSFLEFPHVDFYGYNIKIIRNTTFEKCRQACLELCDCVAFQYKFMENLRSYSCYPKTELRNGHLSDNFNGSLLLKFPRSEISSYNNASLQEVQLNCSTRPLIPLPRSYYKPGGDAVTKILLWCAGTVGLVELLGILILIFVANSIHKQSDAATKGYLVVATGFRRFTYHELKKATQNFTKEIGRGGAGVVYKGTLSDERIAAIKRLTEAKQGEETFLAEVSTIGRLNHINLIDMWGYCMEKNNRLLVYEYVGNGSLADNLQSNSLDWEKRLQIALGIAKGLAYLHEECLEWVLHCDVKPQNILLDSNYQPKVADFGLSKILNRGDADNLRFSRIRGTRGYMAPEWIYNLPITSKVDVYSYGIVVLEMVTGKDPTAGVPVNSSGEMGNQRFVAWVREKKNEANAKQWVQEIIDPRVGSEYDVNKVQTLLEVALKCAEEEKDGRPSMSQVVEMLLNE